MNTTPIIPSPGACAKSQESSALSWRDSSYPACYRGRVPWKIRVLKEIKSDIPAIWAIKPNDPATVLHSGDIVECRVNMYGAVAGIRANGELLGLKPGEFEVIQFHGEPPPLFVTVRDCARCGGTHVHMAFQKLQLAGQAPGSEWSHWTSCPETGEPIMLAIVDAPAAPPIPESATLEQCPTVRLLQMLNERCDFPEANLLIRLRKGKRTVNLQLDDGDPAHGFTWNIDLEEMWEGAIWEGSKISALNRKILDKLRKIGQSK